MSFKPFSEDSLIMTDNYGNELTLQQDENKISIFGEWQGNPKSKEFVSFVDIMNTIMNYLNAKSIKTAKSLKGINIKVASNEVILKADVDLLQDETSAGKVLGFINKTKKLKP